MKNKVVTLVNETLLVGKDKEAIISGITNFHYTNEELKEAFNFSMAIGNEAVVEILREVIKNRGITL